MVSLHQLVAHIDGLLEITRFQDYAPNGLQVEGRSEVRRLVSGVTANQALIEAALARNADAILVHHGYFWRNENPCVTGMKRRRLASLLQAGMSLLAYHLPLDAHPVYGNNVQLARVLGIAVQGTVGPAPALVFCGDLSAPHSGEAFALHVARCLGRSPLYIPGASPRIQKIAWCSGAAQSYIHEAMAAGADAYLTGEVSEATVHVARETGMHFYAAGHHATERYGIAALGEHLAAGFGLDHHYIEIDNPV